ncbi:MAG: phenylalanine--tRNA ligase subunit alpha [Deferribacteraceae bacterium]|jgi:phenylalanyl-tRNA synthetase alpha chain|nr:phenylalanine--tRNA ligase subunit alpha [Deferribacteraceae bacterium]
MDDYKPIREDYLHEIAAASSLDLLYAVKVRYMGKKGLISEMNKNLAKLPPEEKPIAGAEIGKLRNEFTELYEGKEKKLKERELSEKLLSERLDVTLPGLALPIGSAHILSRTASEIADFFASMGYSVASGPEVELDYYNFEALNMPYGHPARDMQDTFYVSDSEVMRTHTSPVQIRTMLIHKPPIRIIAPGKVYRSDYDVTHSPMFHQVEGLYIDENISMGDLKGTLERFVKALFGSDVPVRFRASYFPFTEPSMEVDMGCSICGTKGCRVCKNTGWLEIGGCGMVAPEVFEAVKIDYDQYSGFAFGMGVERIAMLKYGIDDIRLFFENHVKFLNQF